ncbi:MAG TPA: hypothetical protein VD993_03770 [Chitinophagaceae bacterium]|nr:hypothetical protein [Chitinophagaceae bacterium]
MKHTTVLACLLLFCITAHTQVYRERIGFELESIADIDIGWIKVYKYPTPPKSATVGNRTYSSVQIGYVQQLIQWMQQSYLPKGCLGDAAYYVNQAPKFSGTNSRLGNAVNTHLQALPHLYGAYTKMYMFLKKDAAGKFAPQNNFAEYWNIEANGLQHISEPVSFISSPEEYYFILPDFKAHSKGYQDEHKPASDFKEFDDHKNIAAYKHFYIPPKVINDNPHYVVIMTKNNELPFEKITIGEFFTQVEKQLPFWQSIDPVPTGTYAVAQKNLARLKEKYKSKWNEPANMKLSSTQISLYTFVNAVEGQNDLFDNKDIYGNESSIPAFPVLKVKKAARELCKTDRPQWLVIRWTMGMPNKRFNIHMHESILNKFNFEYVYNFFFYPEKIKGKPYRPLP